MELTEGNGLLRLAVGSHRAGSGKGCAMNVLSWENGDATITDMPDCADSMLTRMIQFVNDRYCMHRDNDLLCPSCSVDVLQLAHRVVGTNLEQKGFSAGEIEYVHAHVVHDIYGPTFHFVSVYSAGQRLDDPTSGLLVWLDSVTQRNFFAQQSSLLSMADMVLDRFYEVAGITPDCVPAEVAEMAIQRMQELASVDG